ncbi:hypothetical protein WN943_022410 [Citrus x changshan-huyou]
MANPLRAVPIAIPSCRVVLPTPPIPYRPTIPTGSSVRHLQTLSKVDCMPPTVGGRGLSSTGFSGTV